MGEFLLNLVKTLAEVESSRAGGLANFAGWALLIILYLVGSSSFVQQLLTLILTLLRRAVGDPFASTPVPQTPPGPIVKTIIGGIWMLYLVLCTLAMAIIYRVYIGL